MPLVNPAGIPNELKQRYRWVVYRLEPAPTINKPHRTCKVPIDLRTGQRMDALLPTNWSTIDRAAAYALTKGDNHGIGYVLTVDDPVILVDLDECFDKDRQLQPWAQTIVEGLDSYMEVSPSGRGLHIYVYGHLPSNLKAKKLELYASGRFTTVTGNHWPGTPKDIRDKSQQLLDVYAEWSSSTLSRTTHPAPALHPVHLSDDKLLERMFTHHRGDILKRLWDGDWRGYPSQSEADLALCNALAFWTAGDEQRIDALFRRSGLMRAKWDRAARTGETYGQGTVRRAVQDTKAHYQPQRSTRGVWPDTGEVTDLADILAFLRWKVDHYQFQGRNADTQKDVALAIIQVFEQAGSLETHMSDRDLGVRTGKSHPAVGRALRGWKDAETKQFVGPKLTDWLVDVVTPACGVGATIYRVQSALLEEYRAKVSTLSSTPPCGQSMWKLSSGIAIVEENMADDAFARNTRAHRLAQDTSGDVPMPQQERRQTLATLMNSRPEDLRKLMKSFTRTSLGIIEALTNENGQSLSELAMKLHRSPETISAAVKRMSHRLVERGLTPIVNVEPDPDDRRVKRVWLDTKWRDHVADARSHLVTDGIGRAREIWYARERHIRAEMYLQWLTNADQIELCQKIVAKAQRTIDRAGDPRGKDSIRSGSLTGALDDGERAAAGQR